MKITRTDFSPLTPRQQSEPAVVTPQSRPTVSQSQTVFSGTVRELEAVRAGLAQTSEVDMDKVSALRQAIADGQLPLDLDALSAAIVDLHRS